MPFLDAYDGVRRITVGDPERGYWIDLKEFISYRAREEAEKALSKVFITQGVQEVRPDSTRFRQLMVLAHIDKWNLDDEKGIWPVNLDNVKRIPGAEFDRIWSVVDELGTPVQDAAERRGFPDEGNDGDPERDGGTTEPE